MKLKLLVSRSGVNFTQNAGDLITVDDAEGLRMISSGQAELIKEVEKTNSKKIAQKAAK